MNRPKTPSRQSAKGKAASHPPARPKAGSAFPLVWLAVLLVLTGAVYWPMLHNQFTNWDDEKYVLSNGLLAGPDWQGILSKPVASNYHPLTVLSLALNYQMTQLRPISYLATNWILHLANTGIVFYLIWVISSRVGWVALFTAAVFALHPMHVESVAWVSERKDLLYTFFYLLALISYWRYLVSRRQTDYWLCFGLFLLSVMSKPAAIVLPLSMLLLDYWHDRRFEPKLLWNKIPFLALGLLMGVVTVLTQAEKALAPLEKHSVTDRFFFGCHGLLAYVARFIVPAPLSAFHPFPPPGRLEWTMLAAPIFVAVSAAALWYLRRQRALLFGTLFYVVNIVLVVQFIAVGNTLLAERYTYVPYIGLAFALAMSVARKWPSARAVGWGLVALVAVGFAYPTHQRTRVWKNSETLWSDAIRKYPGTPIPCSNRAIYYGKLALQPENASRTRELFEMALRDCDAALATQPNHYASLDTRSVAALRLDRPEAAWSDADRMIQVEPANPRGYELRGSANWRLRRYDEALADFDRVLERDPNNLVALDGKGSALFNSKKAYQEALALFDKAVSLNPQGAYYLNRSKCYFMLQNLAKAREDAETARRLGQNVPAEYWDSVHPVR